MNTTTSSISPAAETLSMQSVQAFVDRAPIAILIAERSRIRYANSALAQLLRYPLGELIEDVHPLDLFEPVDREQVEHYVLQPTARRLLQTLRARCSRKDGTVFAGRLSYWTIPFDGEDMLALAIDEAEPASDGAQLAALLGRAESLTISGACEYDIVSGLLTRSPGLIQLFGEDCQDEAVWVEWLLDRVPDHERDLVRAILEAERPGLSCEIEHSIRRRNGGMRTVLHRCVAVLDAAGKPCRTVSVLQDITVTRALENERCNVGTNVHHWALHAPSHTTTTS